MRKLQTAIIRCIFGLVFCSLMPGAPSAQTSNAQPRINQAIDNTRLTMLHGNVHPLASAEFDRGAAPASLPMDHMQLVLKHSAQQEAALQQLLTGQQDPASPNYHKWLTPEEFGQQFGVADQDLQQITSWLQSQGFQVDEVVKGRNIIEFSGNAGQIQQAFHSAIHKYVLANGEEHWANASDPQIPTALTPVVAGINTLHNFYKKPANRIRGQFRRTKATGKITPINPEATFNDCQSSTGAAVNCFAIGPGDFGTIYDVTPLWNLGINGSGETIAIVSDSNINVSDANSFRSLFGLNSNPPQIILNGTNPGVIPCADGGDECEAILDVEWAGAIAPSATIDLVVSPSTNTTFGGDSSAVYIVNNKTGPILSYSYGACELALGTTENQFYNTEWQQAASEGITVVVSTGDNGSAGCDAPTSNFNGSAQPAQFGLAVNGLATTPYDVAVGGTDFNDLNNPTTYFSNTSGTLSSAMSYIPEIAYNDTCTNPVIYGTMFGFSSAEPACNSVTLIEDNYVNIGGGNGGASNCITNMTTSSAEGPVSSCNTGSTNGWPKPTWQTGTGVPNDHVRDIPDLSLFAGDGTLQNFYIVCEADEQNSASCNLNNPYQDFTAIGGTSVSAQAFAGLMALIDQQAGKAQGLPNPNLYRLAAAQSPANCNSSGTVSGTCTFYDVTSGTIAMPCVQNSPNCTINTSGDTIGVLSTTTAPGFNAGTGYDQATGLGSVNACNLVENWGGGNPSFLIGTGSCPASTSVSSAGSSGTATVTVTGVNGFTGTVSFSCSGLPSGASCTFNPTSVALSATTTSATTQVTVNTTTSSFLSPSHWPAMFGSGRGLYELALLGALCVALLIFTMRTKRRSIGVAVASAAIGAFLVFAVGCGGSSGSNGSVSSTTGPTGLTHATITATSGSVSETVAFNVTIQ